MDVRQARANRRRHGHAFTLVELLVVIGIIAVLISILLPSLSRARKQARSTQCLSNLRQLHMAFNMYLAQNKGKPYAYEKSTGGPLEEHWMAVLVSYHAFVDALRFCPEAADRRGPDVFAGDAFHAWGDTPALHFIQDKDGSYGMNAWVYWTNIAGNGGGMASHGAVTAGPKENFFTLPAKFDNDIPLYGDAIWFGGWPKHTDTPPPDLTGNPFPPEEQEMRRFCINRHTRAINMVFLDGHAERVPLPNLWMLKWNRNFIVRTTPITLPPH